MLNEFYKHFLTDDICGQTDDFCGTCIHISIASQKNLIVLAQDFYFVKFYD